jgi:rod shape-determining protein MreB
VSLFSFLLNAATASPYYVRLRRDRLTVHDTKGLRHFDDEPLVALSQDDVPRILAIGSGARTASKVLINPFQHPRILIADFVLAEKVLMHAFRVVLGSSWLRPMPTVVMHVTEKLEGGLSSIETRAVMELCAGAGAYKTYLWEGHELSQEELRSGTYRTGA